ncbi:hypothetical protein Tco_0911675 [Tanacetum coccineum]|uniref:Uncharacterized protein n=1 Tax=Tanacetum coccineum TaxID=301880 RepID=A0ABQ5CWD1_9ASTR
MDELMKHGVKNIDDTPEQSCFNKIVQAVKPPLTFDELMITPIDFSAFAMNRLKIDNIIRAYLVDQLDWTNPEGHLRSVDMSEPLPLQDKEGQLVIPVEFFFNNDLEYLKVGNKERMYSSSITKTPAARYTLEGIEEIVSTLWSPIVLTYDKDATLEISHWGPQHQLFYKDMINMVSKNKVFSTMRILSVVSDQVEKRFGYGYLKEITVMRADQRLYKFKEGDFLDLHLNDIEDILLLIAQNKLFNLDGDCPKKAQLNQA